MPIYGFKCPDHGETERLLPMSEAAQEQRCHCGKPLTRVFSLAAFKVRQNGRDVVLETLNREHKGKPTRETELMAAGLEEPKNRFIGRGF